MEQADAVRRHVADLYIHPARDRGEHTVVVRSGEVASALGLSQRLPNVCSAMGGSALASLAGVSIERNDPAPGANVLFTYKLEDRDLTPATAEKELRARYGEPTKSTAKLVAFALPDGRALALQLDITKVQLWLEDGGASDAPPAQEFQPYPADKGRHSNLPDRLSHDPPASMRAQGFPKPVVSVRTSTLGELVRVLAWYEGTSMNIDRAELEKLKQAFVAYHDDFEALGFEATTGKYWAEERGYKQQLLEDAEKTLSESQASSDSDLGTRLLKVLLSPQSNLFGWRMVQHLAKVRAENPGLIEAAAGKLVRSRLAPPEAVGEFVRATWPSYSEGQEGNMPYRDTRTLPTMLLALAKPSDAIAVRYQPFHTAGMRLLHKPLFKNAPFSADEYRSVLEMSDAIAQVMRNDWGWKPRDLWDVQGFIWQTCTKSGQVDENSTPSLEEAAMTPSVEPTNLILYGPPGTGKTYATAEEAVRLCDGALPDGGRAALKARYDQLKDAGRIAFVTFHQSVSYEDFVEGLRPDTGGEDDDSENVSGGFRLKPVPGVFKRIATLAEQSGRPTTSGPGVDVAGRNFFKMSLGRATDQGEIYDAAIEGGYIALGWGNEHDWSDTTYDSYDAILARQKEFDPTITGKSGHVSQLYCLRNRVKKGDIIIASHGNMQFKAVGVVVGDYEYVPDPGGFPHRRKVRWLRVFDKPLAVDTIFDGNFIQTSHYQLSTPAMKLGALQTLLGEAGGEGAASVPEPYVLVIDEINRANVSKVFGELITLIEPDKRLGAENALTVTLPYSGEDFGVPANLHIVGTMNTADRSIALLDIALRRRFEFAELMPRPDLLGLASQACGLDLGGMLTTLNDRIEYLFDRDHQVGHAYFMSAKSRSDLDRIMRTKVIPLLAEYFYENWERVRQVLGEGEDEGGFIVRKSLKAPKGSDADLGGDRYRYTVRNEFSDEAYAQLGS